MGKIPTYFTDTETCGLHGVPVLLQYAKDDGDVILHHLWLETIESTIEVIEMLVDGRVVAHNLRFDWFMLSKFYNMLRALIANGTAPDTKPIDLPVDYMATAEWHSQFGPCLKPRAAIDTWLLASKGEDQSYLMDTKALYVRRVPIGMADTLCAALNEATDLPWLLFAGKKDKEQRWVVVDNTDRRTGEVDPYWKDCKISFKPSKGLKDLAVFLCGHKSPVKFDEIAYEKYPAEEGFAPFATLLSSADKEWLYPVRKKNTKGEYVTKLVQTWPGIVHEHVKHWETNADAQAYAEDDIHMLRKLYEKFGSLLEDEDSMVACQVASVRLRGFKVNIPGVEALKVESTSVVQTARLNVNSPKQVAGFIAEALDPMEQLILTNGCDQKVIDSIKIEFTLEEEEECYCEDGKVDNEGTEVDCPRCNGQGSVGPGPMPVVDRAKHIESVRKHSKRVELFNKLLLAKRAYPDFNVIGTKSGRMSGASGLNFQGIDHSDAVRSLFVLADDGLVLSAGDYAGQELAIAATAMKDDDLMRDMQSGQKLHGIFAAQAYETTYEEIMRSYEEDDDPRYGKGKGGVFAILYGGTFETVAKNMGIDVAVAEAAYNRMVAKYPQMGNTRKAITERFSSMHQTAEGKIEYRDPPEKFIESVFGFKRYFETEYEIQRMILSVIKNMPQQWKDIDLKVERKEGKLQSMSGALCSALYGAAFSIQNKVIRASNNHVIQSTGRHLTVGMQAAVWEIQPQGIHEFLVTLMSIHDELAVVSDEKTVPVIQQVLESKVAEQCSVIPLTSIEWFTGNKSWAEKGHGAEGRFFGWQP